MSGEGTFCRSLVGELVTFCCDKITMTKSDLWKDVLAVVPVGEAVVMEKAQQKEAGAGSWPTTSPHDAGN